MKRISTSAALMLCLTLLTACGNAGGSTADTTSSLTDTTVSTEQTTDSAAGSAEQQPDTTASSAAADSTSAQSQTESTAAASESTSASAASTGSSAASTSASTTASTTAKQTALNLFEAAAVGKDCSAYVAATPGSQFSSAPSCMGPGEDRVYTYKDYEIKSYYNNGKDIVQEIDLKTKNIATPDGLKIGMTTDDIERVHGAPATPGDYTYVSGTTAVEFLLEADDHTIRLITYYSTVDPV